MSPLTLRAGPLTALYHPDTGFIRGIHLGDREVLRGIYAAVRDRDWRTIPARIRESHREIGTHSFLIEFEAEHQSGGIHFQWQGRIQGSPEGSIHYLFHGLARSSFWKNRIGFCVLHPIRECAGQRAITETIDSATREVQFPGLVAERQPLSGFTSLARITHEARPGVWAHVTFSGDLFETEDQRNWTDASFKTYCTPSELPIPAEIKAGTQVHQEIQLRLEQTNASEQLELSSTASQADSPETLGDVVHDDPSASFQRLPELGTALSRSPSLSPAELDRLAALQLGHFRIGLDTRDAASPSLLERAAREAAELGLSLEVVITCDSNASSLLDRIRTELSRLRVDLTRILILTRGSASTTAEALAAARAALADMGVPLGAGTAGDLYDLHSQPPPADADFIAWSMNPQVHVFDDLSILETPEAVADQLRTVRTRHPDAGIVVSPITLKPRAATDTPTEFPSPDTDLPDDIDPRQATMLGAVWTIAMLSVLLSGGCDAVTFFEATGLKGLMLRDDASPPPAFPARPGMVFPCYHVFRGLAGARFHAPVRFGAAEDCVGLRLQDGHRMDRLIIANCGLAARHICLNDRHASRRVRILDPSSTPEAMLDPASFWRSPASTSSAKIILPSLGIAFADLVEEAPAVIRS